MLVYFQLNINTHSLWFKRAAVVNSANGILLPPSLYMQYQKN